jgi:hypothetical protein
MHHGQLLDIEYNPNNNIIYKGFTDYFSNPIMTKIKNVHEYSMYLTKIHCLLTNIHRYIIVFVIKDVHSIGIKESLKNLYWKSLHTRGLEDVYNVPLHTYTPRHMKPLSSIINIVTRDKDKSVYKCEDLGLEVILLHKKNQLHEYNDKGTIISSLETYNTIITFSNS